MARNIYFSEKVRSEQALYEDIVVEALKIYGYDMYYLPRDVMKSGDLLNEDPSSRFNSSYMIEMYVDNIEGFDGQGDLFQKFGVEIRDAVTLTVSRRRWAQAVKRHDNELTSERPLEGDLIYVPFSRKLFQIMKVEHEAPFYQLTNLPTYKLQCELFEYSGDDFDTGVEVVDQIERSYAYKYILNFTSGVNAAGTAVLDSSGSLSSITLTNAGTGYTSVPEITISRPTASKRQAVARVYTNNNSITSYEIIDSGEYYLLPPTIQQLVPETGPRYKFGDNALHHDSAGAYYPLPEAIFNSTLNNRQVYRFFYYPDSSSQDYNTLLGATTLLTYHRRSDNKVVFQDSEFSVVSNGTVQMDDWNYLELHLLNNQVKVNVNGVDGTPGTIRVGTDAPINFRFGRAYNNINPSANNSFIGSVDHFAYIQTGDLEFRDADPIPVTTAQVERDGDTLALADYVNTFNNERPVLIPTLVNGRLSSLIISNSGTYMTDSSYDLVISAPEGTADYFVARASAVINPNDGSIIFAQIDYPGSGYLTPPRVTIRPQGADVLFTPGDKVYQTLPSGVVLEADVAQFSDSDYRLHVVNIQTSDGKYHDFSTGVRVNRDSANGPGAFVISVDEVQQLSEIEQNDQFSVEAASFLDFTETNPFGDPE